MKLAIRGDVLTFQADPFLSSSSEALWFQRDMLVLLEEGHITAMQAASDLLPTLSPDIEIHHYPGQLILPGFIDSHVHYPQTEMIAAPGKQLIDWLQNYTFVSEQGFADIEHAQEVAERFITEQLRHGVTSSCVFGTVHPASIEALFKVAAQYDLRLMAGKVCMDRHAPAALLDTPRQAYEDSLALIQRWHGRGRAEYVITPRFAPTSSPEQLEMLGSLAQQFPQVLIQSHISENPAEIAWAQSLFPDCRDYASIYHRYGLLRPRAIYGHGIHLSEAELELLYATGTSLAHCPSSNFFLGSGCFDIQRARRCVHSVKVGLGTDLGAGTSFSMLQTMGEAYKAAQFHGYPLTAPQAFYLATRGAAEALGIADKVGSVAVGMEADLAIINMHSTALIDFRMRYARDLNEALFIQMMLADDRAISATYVAGKRCYHATAA
ncbi:guanine deaminase [Neisseriaceae bacterium TC5R-5]|nr:guanine deaminase [Neisseriaceae bacterium TC5R-5]